MVKDKPIIEETDRHEEYLSYKYYCDNGFHKLRRESIVDACFMSNIVPALIQRLTHLPSMGLFKVYSCFFLAAMPEISYLASRLYFGTWESLLVAFFIMSSFYFLYDPNIGRVGIAIPFLSLLFYGILSDDIPLVAVAAVLVGLSHYGTICVALFILGISHLVLPAAISITLPLVILLLILVVWHMIVMRVSGMAIWSFVSLSISGNSHMLEKSIANSPANVSFWSPRRREGVIQSACAVNWKYFTIPQKIEFFLSWMMVLAVSCGAVLISQPVILKVLVIASFVALIITGAIPHISIFYGIARVYFSVSSLLALCFVAVAHHLGVLVIAGVLCLFYGLTVGGITYKIFGFNKRR